MKVFESPPGDAVKVYDVMFDPPLEALFASFTRALRFPVEVATIEVGALGTPTVAVELDALDATESPIALRAVTVKVYEVDGFRPVIEIVPELAWVIVAVIPPGVEVAV